MYKYEKPMLTHICIISNKYIFVNITTKINIQFKIILNYLKWVPFFYIHSLSFSVTLIHYFCAGDFPIVSFSLKCCSIFYSFTFLAGFSSGWIFNLLTNVFYFVMAAIYFQIVGHLVHRFHFNVTKHSFI